MNHNESANERFEETAKYISSSNQFGKEITSGKHKTKESLIVGTQENMDLPKVIT